MGDIGTEKREIELEPIETPQTAPVPAPAEPEKVPA